MKPCPELLKVIEPAYAPCVHFGGACSSLRWDPDKGHIPRGFLGATSGLAAVKLVLVFAEPGDPHIEQEESYASTYEYSLQCMRGGKDQFHRNVRLILDLCFPDESIEAQMEKTWMTESLLCSAPKESGAVAASAWRACTSSYLKPQLELLSHAVVAALGSKASSRISSIGVPFIAAAAAAPPGCNFKGSRESWQRVADAVRHR